MRGNISSLTGFLQLPDGRQPDLHGEVGDESGGGQVHLKGRLLDDGELVPHRALDGGDGIAGHHGAPHVVLRHLQLRQKHASLHQRKDHKWGFSPDGSEQNSRTELQAAQCVGQNPLLTGTQEKLVNNRTHHSPPFFSFMSPFSLHGNDTQQLPAWSGGALAPASTSLVSAGHISAGWGRVRSSLSSPRFVQNRQDYCVFLGNGFTVNPEVRGGRSHSALMTAGRILRRVSVICLLCLILSSSSLKAFLVLFYIWLWHFWPKNSVIS